jgi:hypothetical protein
VSFVLPLVERWTLRHCKYFYVCKVITPNAAVHTAIHVVAFPHIPERAGVFCRNMFTRIRCRGLVASATQTASRFYRYGPLQSMNQVYAVQSMTHAIIVQDQLPEHLSVLKPYLCTLKRAPVVHTSPSHSSHMSQLHGSGNSSSDSIPDHMVDTEGSELDEARPNTFIIREEQLVEKALAFSMHNMNDTAVRNDLPHVLSAMYQASGMRLHSDIVTQGIPQRISDEFTSRADDEFADRFSPFYFANLICTDPSA